VFDQPLVYLDNAATTQKPKRVLEAMEQQYFTANGNVHRGIHRMSELATEKYEEARMEVCRYLNAQSPREIVFTRGTTESINLLAHTYAQGLMNEGDEVILSEMEHHSNIVPWQLAADIFGIRLKVVPILETGDLDLEAYQNLFGPRTKMVSLTHVSNVLGTVNPVAHLVDIAHRHGVPVHIDGAQGAAHIPVDVQSLDVDFYSFSGHKAYGPTGIGVLYGKEKWLDKLPPYQGGGEMISHVSFEGTTYNDIPLKFEAGTPNYVGAIGLAEALRYINSIGLPVIQATETFLTRYALRMLRAFPHMHIYGSPAQQAGVISFQLGDIHPLDLATLLNRLGIAIRTGHHCAEPLMKALGVEGTARLSLAFYNTLEEIDSFCEKMNRIQKMF